MWPKNEEDVVDGGAGYIRNVMRWLKMIDGEPEPAAKTYVMREFLGLRARRGGLLFNRARLGDLVKAGDTLYLIGPPDLVDEEESFVQLTKGDPKVQKILAQQEAALQGKQGALLLVIDVKTGLTKATKKLPALPVWDSLAVANGKLFYTTQTGEVICLGE